MNYIFRATFHKTTSSQIYAIIRLPWLHSKELLIISHVTFFSYKEDKLQIWSRSDEQFYRYDIYQFHDQCVPLCSFVHE